MVVQFRDFEGQRRVLVWEPTVPEGSAEAPFYEQLIERFGEFLSNKVFATYYNTVEQALAQCGLGPADVDYVSFDHLHVQDMRILMGTSRSGRPPAVLPEREVRLPAQGGRHVQVDPSDAVGLVRAGRAWTT